MILPSPPEQNTSPAQDFTGREALFALQQQILVSFNLPAIRVAVVNFLARGMPVQAGGLMLLEDSPEAGGWLLAHLPAGKALPVEYLAGDAPAADWPGLAELRAGRPWLCSDLAAAPPFAGREMLLDSGAGSLLDLPLVVCGNLVGAMCLAARQAHAFSAEQVAQAGVVAELVAPAAQQAYLMALERQRYREHDVMQSMMQVMRSAQTQQELYSLFLPQALTGLGAQCGAVFVLSGDPQGDQTLSRLLMEGLPCQSADFFDRPVLQQGLRQALRDRCLLLLAVPSGAPGEAAGSLCALLPLKSGAQLIGVMVIAWASPPQPPFHSRQLLGMFEEVLSVALTRLAARETLEMRMSQRTRELMALYEITRLYVSTEDIQTIAEQSLRVILTTLNARAGLIHLVNPQGPLVNVVAHAGLDLRQLSEVPDFDQDSSQWRRISESGSPLLILNLPGRDDLPRAIANSGFQSFLASPIRARHATLGAISLFYEGERPYLSVEDLNLVDLIADQLGMVIERLQLRQNAKDAAILEERQRLARELHDSVTQSLYSLSFIADAARSLAEQKQWERMNTQLALLQESAQQALKEMRLLVYELVPASIEEQGLATVVRQRLNYVEKRAGMETDLRIEGDLDLPVAVQLGVYRILQEALNNVIKHAYARRVQVNLLCHPSGLRLEVSDDGVGFDVENQPSGMGLRNMRDRAAQLGGRLLIMSRPASVESAASQPGTRVVFVTGEESV